MVSLIGGYRFSRRLFTAMLLLSKKILEKSNEKIDWSKSVGEYGVQDMLYEHIKEGNYMETFTTYLAIEEIDQYTC